MKGISLRGDDKEILDGLPVRKITDSAKEQGWGRWVAVQYAIDCCFVKETIKRGCLSRRISQTTTYRCEGAKGRNVLVMK
jgi:6-phosphogluconate dehydrogenase